MATTQKKPLDRFGRIGVGKRTLIALRLEQKHYKLLKEYSKTNRVSINKVLNLLLDSNLERLLNKIEI